MLSPISEYVKSIVCALLLAVLITGSTLPVQAQFAVIDAANVSVSTKQLAKQIQDGVVHLKNLSTNEIGLAKTITEYAQQAERWIRTVQQYTNEIFQMARQFTSMKGVLGIAMQGVGLQSDDLKAMKEWATALYAVINVKRQFDSLWESRMTLFRAWWSRAKNGVFNPQQDWIELQRYFLDSIGKRSYEYELELEKLRQLDHEFELWRQELEKLRKEEADLANQKKEIHAKIADETTLLDSMRAVTVDDNTGTGQIDVTYNRQTVSQGRVTMLTTQLSQVEDSLRDVQSKIQDLINKMNNRYTYYFLTYGKSIEGSDKVFTDLQGWENFGGLRLGELNRLIDFNQNTGQALPEPSPAP